MEIDGFRILVVYKNKAEFTASEVACGLAGSVLKKAIGQEQ